VRPKIFYGYVVVTSSFLIMAIIWGTNAAFGVFFEPLLKEFGWTRASTSLASSLNNVVFGIICIFSARLIDRFGPRLIGTICALVLAASYYLLSLTDSLWQLYLFYGLLVPFGMSPYVSLLSLVARWFDKRRATMTAAAFIGMAAGTVVMPMVSGTLITGYDWRISLVIISVISLVIFLIAAQFLKPARKNTPSVSRPNRGLPEKNEFTLRDALHTRQFWILGALYFIFLYTQLSILLHIVIHATALGVSLSAGASTISIIGGLSVVGMITMGPTADRLGIKPAMAISYALMAVSLYWLIAANDLWGIYLFAIIYGVAYGGMQISFSPAVAKLFGLKSHGSILGSAALMGTLGGALGPFFTGFIFDTNTSYTIAFLICALMATAGVLLAILLKPIRLVPPVLEKERQ
jgi:MFS transporter, OFA family, oxalate/formate antiporter